MKHACLQRYFVIRRNNVNHALLPNNEKRLASQSQRGDRAFWQARRGVRNQSHLVALGVSTVPGRRSLFLDLVSPCLPIGYDDRKEESETPNM